MKDGFLIKFELMLIIFLGISTSLWIPGITQNNLQFLIFNYGAIFLFLFKIRQHRFISIKNPLPLVLYLIVVVQSLILNPKGYPISLIVITSGILYYNSLIIGRLDVKKIINTLWVILMINFVVAVIQKYGIYVIYSKELSVANSNPSIFNQHYSMPGAFGRNYHLVYFSLILTPLMFTISKLKGWITYGISLILSILTQSYICTFSFLILTLILFRIDKWNIWLIGLIIGIIIPWIPVKKIINKIDIRKESYQFILNEAMINPLIGKGIGSFDRDINLNSSDPKLQSSFNEYLKIIYEIGFIPSIILIITLFSYYSKFLNNKLFLTSLVMILLYPLFHEVLRFARLDILIITILGLFEKVKEEKNLCIAS